MSENSSLPPTVVEIRCSCLRGFSIRTKEPKKSKLCNKCERLYTVRLYPQGQVTVHHMDKGTFSEVVTSKTLYSIVTDGE